MRLQKYSVRLAPNQAHERTATHSQAMDSQLQGNEDRQRQTRGKDAIHHPKLERTARNATLGAREAQESHPIRYVVRVISVRIRLLDDDNLAEKYAVDFLRYCGAIPSDAPGKCKVETTQRKVEEGEQEHTEVRVWGIHN